MKPTAAVVEAMNIRSAKSKDLDAAREDVKRLESELRQANESVQKAQEEDDSSLPQCNLVLVRTYRGKEDDAGRVVILRQTPGGMLVVRKVGETNGVEYKFKMSKFSGIYEQAEKTSSYDRRRLRDVPKKYLIKEAKA